MVTAMQQPTCFGDLPPRKLAASLRWLSCDLHTAPQFAEWPSEALDVLAVLLKAEAAGPHEVH